MQPTHPRNHRGQRVWPRAVVLTLLVVGCGPRTTPKDDNPATSQLGAPTPLVVAPGRTEEVVRSQDKLKAIANAFHKSAQAKPSGIVGYADEHGKPLLSWRVAILPHLGRTDLFQRFKIDEPWDGPNNRKLLAEMPEVYQPVRGSVQEGYTYYQGFTGERALFPAVGQMRGRTGTGEVYCPMFLIWSKIFDGTSYTFLVVEGGEPVPWTRPNDLLYDPAKPVPKLGGLFDGHFNACFCDGSVHLIPRTIPEKMLRALITPGGEERVDLSEIGLPDPHRKAVANPAPRGTKGTLTGKVTYQGLPLPAGTVALYLTDETKYLAAIRPDGSFTLKDVPVASFRIAVVTTPIKDKPFVSIPRKYHAPQTSSLTVEVKGGEQTLDIDLRD